MSEWITVKAADGGSFDAYVARPESGNGPAVIVIQEIFGVNANIRAIADNLARDGYIAVAPDLFWRQEKRVDITDQSEAEWAKAFELYKGFDVDKGVADLDATLAATRKLDGCTGKVGAVGFCLGGLLAYLMAARTGVDGAVGYYGVGIDAHLDEAKGIRKPLMLHIAVEDGFVDKTAQAKIHNALDGHDAVTLHDYAGVDHGFSRKGGAHHDEAAARVAHDRTLAFFKQNLG
ncbi:MAG: dienelactone hydrolase family protein [Sphingomonadales bacterium]